MWPVRAARLALVLAMQVAVRIAAVSQQPDEIQEQLGNIDTHGLSPQFRSITMMDLQARSIGGIRKNSLVEPFRMPKTNTGKG